MKLFGKQITRRQRVNESGESPKAENGFMTVQTAGKDHPFKGLHGYLPAARAYSRHMEYRMYRELRQAVPIIDAAIDKTVRLMGGFEVHCEDEEAQKALNSFLSGVRVNSNGTGITTFLSTYLNQLLTYGTAVAEAVPFSDGSGIAALYNADINKIELLNGENPLDLKVCVKAYTGELTEVKNHDLLLISTLNAEPGEVYGTSVLSGLPFVSSILMEIFNTIGINWKRVGNVRFAVTYKPSDPADKARAKERAEQIAEQWSSAMSDTVPADFISVGDVDIKVIGADNQILDCSVPARLMLEQIVAKLSIPPFMLGLSWSSTERMSSQQADILTSELEYYRAVLNPIISKICRMWLRLHGFDTYHEINWNDINLQDEVELANAQYIKMQTQKLENELSQKEGDE